MRWIGERRGGEGRGGQAGIVVNKTPFLTTYWALVRLKTFSAVEEGMPLPSKDFLVPIYGSYDIVRG